MANLTFEAGSVAGLLFAIMRVTGLVLGASQLMNRVPRLGRSALVLAVGFFIAVPVPDEALALGPMLSSMFINLFIGLVLGFVSTLILQMFILAGGILDLTSGLGVSALFDPGSGRSATVFERFFDLTALTMFFILGGPRLLVAGVIQTVEVVPLWGAPVLDDRLADVALQAVSRFFVAGLEIAVPALAALFLAEVVLGVGARMLPEANVFLLGLPLKLVIAMASASVVLFSFPTYVSSSLVEMQQTINGVVASFG
ncbi:MAG: hypothetical protein GXP35_08495 [Actinobacteria bacterium]|nr:hypothetical protein [Actinomycetota bacterium]